jgi:hypothetical protein
MLYLGGLPSPIPHTPGTARLSTLASPLPHGQGKKGTFCFRYQDPQWRWAQAWVLLGSAEEMLPLLAKEAQGP